MLQYHIVREVAGKINDAIGLAIESYASGEVEQEPPLTDRLVTRIQTAIEGLDTKGIHWRAKTLTDRGRKAQETEFGADILGVLNLTLPGYTVSKGFLVQAKLATKRNAGELVRQCNDMLEYSNHSYVFIYSRKGVQVAPANEVVAAHGAWKSVYRMTAKSFFEKHLKCEIGDREIRAATPGELDELRRRCRARRAFQIEGEV